MQRESNPELFNLVVEALPLSFLEGMARAIPEIYREALAELTESTVIDEQAMSAVLPHQRRAMVETRIRKEAIAAGLVAATKSTKHDTAKFSFVDAGRIVLTASHVAQPGHQPRSAAFRNEHTELNELLEQEDFFGFADQSTNDSEDGKEEGKIYCYFLYGGEATKEKVTTFAEIAIPAPGGGGYVDHYSLASVLMASHARNQVADAPRDTAFPVPKQQPKEGTGDGGGA